MSPRLTWGLTDRGVLSRHANDLLRTGGWLPTGWIDQTIGRESASAQQGLTSGTLYLAGGVVLPGGRPISNIAFVSGQTALGSGTNQWFCLVDKSLNVLATTVDATSAAWDANAIKSLAVATTVGGSTPGAYTPPVGIEVYVGVMVAAGTTPTLRAVTGNLNVNGFAPIVAATSTTGLTTPASLGATAGALTSIGNLLFGGVS